MNHSSLEIFCVVAEELGIVKAARRLGRAPSNVTTRIQHLEEELDAQLFTRENKRLQLSPQGRQFLVYAKKLLSLGEEARQSLHPRPPAGVLTLGSMECTAASRLPQPLAQFARDCPDIRLILTTQPTRQLTGLVASAALDCALVALPTDNHGQVICPPDLCCQPLYAETLLLVLPASMSPVRHISEIRGARLAAFAQGCTYRDIAINMLSAGSGVEKGVQIHEVSSYHAMLACVASGGCLCLLPESVLNLLQRPTDLRVLPAGSAVNQLIWRKALRSPALDSLRRILGESSNLGQ